MKTLFAIFLSLLPVAAFAQEPTLLSLYGIGGDQEDQVGSPVTATLDGGFIIGIGSTSDVGSGNIDSFCYRARGENIFLKLNGNASNVEWSLCTTDGSYLFQKNDSISVLVGISNASGWAYKILQQDTEGNILWRKTYGNTASAILKDAIATNDGGYLMVGEVTYTDTDFTSHYGGFLWPDIGIIKVDSNGNKIWAKVIGGSYDDEAFKLVPAPDNGCYIFGSTTSNDYDCFGLHNAPDSGSDAYLVRLDANGNIVWHRDLGGTGDDGYYGWAVSDGKGGVIFTSGSNSVDGDVHHNIGAYDYWVGEVDSNNNLLWENSFGSPYIEFPTNMCVATDGSIWITGEIFAKGFEVDTAYGNGDAWVVHIDSTGAFLNALVLGSSSGDEGTMIYPLNNGGVITGGLYGGSSGSFGYLHYFSSNTAFNAFLAILSPNNQTSVRQISVNSSICIFPNPAYGILNIKFDAVLPSKINIAINNIFGQQVYCNTSMNKSLQVDVSEWPAGMYFVKITDENTLINVTKIEIQ